MLKLFIYFALFLIPGIAHAQIYSIVIKGGYVIDPKNNINAVMDIAIQDNKIARVAKNIDPKYGVQVIKAEGMYVTPGLIDIHGHVFAGTEPDHYLSNGQIAVPPDGFTFRVGVTTIVDCGGAGWKSFPTFKKNIIDNAKTRVLSFLNIVGEGMRGGAWEQDTTDMDPKLSAIVARKYKDYIVGFKVAHFEGPEWTPVDRAIKAGKLAGNLPVIIDFGGSTPPLPLGELFLKRLRPGDIFTHAYTLLNGNVRETIVDEQTQQVKPFVWEARKRGILFDVGYGGASFNFSQAIPAIKTGFYPNTISTDLHTGSMNGSMKDQLSVMSKFLAIGMDLTGVINASTWNAATAIKREDLGHLSVGAVADIAVLNLRKGNFGFWDKTGLKIEGKQKLQCEMTIRNGRIVYDLNGIADPVVVTETPLSPGTAILKNADTVSPASFLIQPLHDHRIIDRKFEQVPAIGATVDGKQLFVAWYSGGTAPGPGNYVTVSVSTDYGKSWLNNQLIAYPQNPSTRIFDPAIWRDKFGQMHLSFGSAADNRLWDGKGGVNTVNFSWDGSKLVLNGTRRLSDGIMSNKPVYLPKSDQMLFPVYIDKVSDLNSPIASKPRDGSFILFHNYQEHGAEIITLSPFASIDIPEEIRIHDEPQLVNISDKGEFLCLVRTKNGIYYSKSFDNGKSWSEVSPFTDVGPTTSSRFYIGKLGSGNILLVLNNSTTRNNLTAILSTDKGKTWPYKLVLDSRENVSYPDVDQTMNGDIHVVYDRDRTGAKDILYCRFKEQDIINGSSGTMYKVKVNTNN